jgi:hypothetical protein
MGEERKVYKVLVGKPEGKRPLQRWDQNESKGDWLGGGIGFDWLRTGTSGEML